MHEVVFAIKQQNLDELYQLVLDISNINSKNYGNYKDINDIGLLISNKDSTNILIDYLNSYNVIIKHQSIHGEYIKAIANISIWEDIFSTKFHKYQSITDLHYKDTIHIRAETYTIPIELRNHVTAVFNIIDIPNNRFTSKMIEVDSNSGISLQSGNDYVDINLLNSYYSISSNTNTMSASQMVYASLDQSFSPHDLRKFQATYNIPYQNVTHVVGGHNISSTCSNVDSCIEGNLDIQYLMAVSRKANTTYYYTEDTWTNFLIDVASLQNVPYVISISYASYEYAMTADTMRAFDIEAMKLALRGVTILSSSGDDGVAGFDLGYSAASCGYKPYFPTVSPFVTSVGGTEGPEQSQPEISCGKFHSKSATIVTGGGVSEFYELPEWQKSDVQSYFYNAQSNLVRGYSSSGRSYPDISAMARNYKVVINQQTYLLSGTSASTPVIAGMISLVNGQRLASGKKPLGWINPSLYLLKNSIIKNDIKSGSNNCGSNSGSGSICCAEGFFALNGWDPLTGLGSLHFANFLSVFSSINVTDNNKHYKPTASPVAAPGSPTLQPTSQPTDYASGYLYFVSSTNDCPLQRYAASEYLGYPLKTCISTFGSDGVVKRSRKFGCAYLNGAQYIIKEEHQVPYCSDQYPAINLYSTNCIKELDSNNNFVGSLRLFCDNNAMINQLSIFNSAQGIDGNPATTPQPDSPDYNVLVEYNVGKNKDCNDNQISKFYAVRDKFCFSYSYYSHGSLTTISYQYSYPFYYIYSSNNCLDKYLYKTYSLSTQCFNVNDDDYLVDDIVRDDGSNSTSYGYNGFRQKWIFSTSIPSSSSKSISRLIIIIVSTVIVFTAAGLSFLVYIFREKLSTSLLRCFGRRNEPVMAVASVTTVVPEIEVSHSFVQLRPIRGGDHVIMAEAKVVPSPYSPIGERHSVAHVYHRPYP